MEDTGAAGSRTSGTRVRLSRRLAWIVRPLTSDVRTGAVLAAFAAAFGAIAVALTPTHTGDQVVFGGPIGDAYYWHQLGAQIANGEGFATPLRPGYSALLSIAFALFGPSVAIAKAVNILLSSVTIAAVFGIVRLFSPPTIAVAVSLIFALSPHRLLFSHSLLTEHMGAAFSALALLLLLLGTVGSAEAVGDDDAKRVSLWLWVAAGACTGLSNLARPLTLLALPLVAVVVYAVSPAERVRRVGMMVLGCAAIILPWMAHMHTSYGIWALSANSAEALYAATSAAEVWTGREKIDLIEKGLISAGASVGEWYRLFTSLALENLSEHGRKWLIHTASLIWKTLDFGGEMTQFGNRYGLVAAAAVFAVAMLRTLWAAPGQEQSSNAASRYTLTLLSTAAAIATIGIATGHFAFLVVMATLLMIQTHWKPGLVVVAYFVGTAISHSMFGLSSEYDRLSLMHAPYLVFLHCFPFAVLGERIGWQWVARPGRRVTTSDVTTPVPTQSGGRKNAYVGTGLRLAVVAASALLALGSLRVALHTVLGARPEAKLPLPVAVDRWANGSGAGTPSAKVEVQAIDPTTTIPWNFVKVPSERTGGRSVVLAYLGITGTGVYWTAFCDFPVDALRGRRVGLKVKVGSSSAQTMPELSLLGNLAFGVALSPLDFGRPVAPLSLPECPPL
jgi:4-amino-4-deoxy-L-arabinose transferase-like glycosyltransferase